MIKSDVNVLFSLIFDSDIKDESISTEIYDALRDHVRSLALSHNRIITDYSVLISQTSFTIGEEE